MRAAAPAGSAGCWGLHPYTSTSTHIQHLLGDRILAGRGGAGAGVRAALPGCHGVGLPGAEGQVRCFGGGMWTCVWGAPQPTADRSTHGGLWTGRRDQHNPPTPTSIHAYVQANPYVDTTTIITTITAPHDPQASPPIDPLMYTHYAPPPLPPPQPLPRGRGGASGVFSGAGRGAGGVAAAQGGVLCVCVSMGGVCVCAYIHFYVYGTSGVLCAYIYTFYVYGDEKE